MNRVYRSIWNSTLGAWVAAPETARASGSAASPSVPGNSEPPAGKGVSWHGIAGAIAVAWGLLVATPAHALCTTLGSTISCTGVTVGLVSSTSSLRVNVQNGAQIYTGVIDPVNAISLTGTGITVNNAGRIDPALLPGLVSLASGLSLSNAAGSTITVDNNSTGEIMGTSTSLGLNLLNLGGVGLVVQNGAGGITTIGNSGLISGTPLLGAAVLAEDIAVIALRGGARNLLTNNATGIITGRVAMQASTSGNIFTNAGTVKGSINLGTGTAGASGANIFNAVTGSVVSAGAGVGIDLGVLGGLGIAYAGAGIVNGGLLNNGNTLNLMNAIGGGSGINGTGTINATNYVNFNNLVVSSGTWTMTGQLFKPGTNGPSVKLNGGLLRVDSNALLGVSSVNVNGGGLGNANSTNATVSSNLNLIGNLTANSDLGLTLNGVLSGSGTLTKIGTGTLTLNGNNTLTSGTTLTAGTLSLGNASALGASTNSLSVTGTSALTSTSAMTVANAIALSGANLTVNSTSALNLSGVISSTGSLTKTGTGDLTLSGSNTYTGGTTISGGRLKVEGSLASGSVNVASGASLGGSGSMSGQVTLQSGATLAPGASSGTGSLTVGKLSMAKGSTLAVALGAPGASPQTPGLGTSVSVTGDLALNGVNLNISNAGSYSPGLYRLFDYGGMLTLANGGFGALPPNTGVQFLTGTKQINLVSTQGMTLNFWNANVQASSAALGGGSGVWSNTAPRWSDALGTTNAVMTPQPSFAVFGGAAGTVTVDGAASAVQATGLQFASDGYRLAGDALTLVADASYAAPAEVRVGDGSTASSAWTATLDNEIVGSDGLRKTGAGTLVLNGSNSYSGDTTVEAGTLSVSNDGNLGAAGARLTLNGGTLRVTGTAFANNGNRTWALGNAGGGVDIADAQNNFQLGSVLAGTGGLNKAGAGTLTLAGSNTYTGGTTIQGGTLALGAGGSLAASGALHLAAAGAAFDMTQASNQTIGALSGVAGTAVDVGAHRLTLGEASDSTFSGSISGTGGSLVKNGTGAFMLTGANSYSGGTAINAGTLVAANAYALGTGNVTVGAAALEVAAGTTLKVGGDLTFQAGSTYRVYADPASNASSRIDVDGTATLAGGVLHVGNAVNAATDYQVGQTYTILHAKGGLSGSFDMVGSNFAYLDTTLGYTGTDVQLSLARKTSGGGSIAFADLAQSSNQAAVANGVERLGRGHALFDFIETLPAGAPPTAFQSLSGDAHASVGSSLAGLAAFSPSVSQQHLRTNMAAGMYAGASVAQNDGPLPASAWPSSKALPAWAEMVGHWQRYGGDGNADTLKQRTTGLFLGMDEEMGHRGWRVGGSVGFTNAEGKMAERASESDVNSYSAAIYGGKSFGTGTGPRINVLGGLAYTWHDIETTRRVESLGQTLEADYSAHTAQLFAEVGYAIGQYDKVGFEPFVGMSLGQQRTGSFQERGGFAALQGRSSTDDLVSTTLGLRMHSDFQLAGKDARVRATVGWRHAFGDVTASKTMAFEGGQNFTVAGAPLARNTAVLGLEGEVALSRTAALVLGYRGELGSGQRDHAANVKLRWSF